jgi:hypothetical protein
MFLRKKNICFLGRKKVFQDKYDTWISSLREFLLNYDAPSVIMSNERKPIAVLENRYGKPTSVFVNLGSLPR